MDLLLGFVYIESIISFAGVMHEADDAYSIQSMCYWLYQFLTLALNAWISSKFSTFHWIRLLFILLISVFAELALGIVITLS